jgi:hypothetical protein
MEKVRTSARRAAVRGGFTSVKGACESCGEGGAGCEVKGRRKAAKYLRVKVVDHTKEGRPAVNIKVPIGVVKWG